MAQPTPQTLRVFEMFEMFDNDEPVEQQAILQYITNNQAHIDVNYPHPEQGTMLLQSIIHEHEKVTKKLLDLGATLNERMIDDIIYSIIFSPPVAQAKELMNSFLNAGFPREKMMHALIMLINNTHNELLKTLLEQPLDINYKHEGDTALHMLITTFSDQTEDLRGLFIDMLRTLMKKGANPNIVNDGGRTAIQLVNQLLADRHPGRILQILQAPAAPAAPVAPAAAPLAAAPAAVQNYKKLWTDELMKPSPDIAKLEEYKNAGAIDVNAMIDSRENPLSLRLSKNSDMKLIEALLKWGANPNLLNWYKTPVFWQVFKRSIKDVKPLLLLLIKYGADVKLTTNATSLIAFIIDILDKRNPVFTNKHKEIADILIENGVDVNYKFGVNNDDVLDIGLDGLDDVNNETFEAIVAYLLNKGMSMIINGKTRLYYSILKMDSEYFSTNYITNYIIAKLNKLLKFYSNTNDYFRDFLDAALTNPKLVMLPYLYPMLIKRLNPNYNEVYTDGSTPLIKAVQLYSKTPQKWVKEMIETMLEKGAKADYMDPTGKKAADYTTNEDIKALLGSGGFKILWTGFSKGDLDFTNTVFNQVVHAENLATEFKDEWLFSICPICLKHVQHETATCMYMTHSCVEQAEHKGYYHKKLWNAFSYKKQYYANGAVIPPHLQKLAVEWCTHCGRICKDHRHYDLAKIYKSDGSIQIPKFAGDGDYYAVTCDKPRIGGGGIKEKINRYRQFREMVYYLNDAEEFINKITYEDAINRLVEAVWEAPLDPRRNIVSHIQKTKKFNRSVANDKYPLPSELPKAPKYIYSIPTYPDAGNSDLLPLVFDKATDAIKNSAANVFGDEENIVQFRHRMANGQINTHDGPNQQIALDRLMGYIKLVNETPNSGDFGMCWQHKLDNYGVDDFLDDKEHKPPKCTAKIYPEELLYILQKANYKLYQSSNSTTNDNIDAKNKHLQIYTDYVYLFGERFGKPIGLAPPNNSNKPNASNSKNYQDGGKRWSTRKRRQSKSKTYRKRTNARH